MFGEASTGGVPRHQDTLIGASEVSYQLRDRSVYSEKNLGLLVRVISGRIKKDLHLG